MSGWAKVGLELRRVSAAVLGIILLGAAAARADVSGTQVLKVVQQERVADGIPGELREDPSLSAGCAKHNRYLAVNPFRGSLTEEQPGAPGYTPQGADVGSRSVVGPAGYFGSGIDAFDAAPFHLASLLDPALFVTGADESEGHVCIVVFGSRTRRAPREITFYSDPRPGATGVATSQVVTGEIPEAPGDLVGLPQGTTTGPYLYLFGFSRATQSTIGGRMDVHSVSLSGPAGQVPARWVDGANGPPLGNQTPSAIIIPVRPLLPGAYCVAVTLSFTALGLGGTHRWPFVTRDAPAGVQPPAHCSDPPTTDIRLVSVHVSGAVVTAAISVSDGIRGRAGGTIQRYVSFARMRPSAPPRRRGGRTIYTLRGKLPGGLFRHIRVTLRFVRSDGGLGGAVSRVLTVG